MQQLLWKTLRATGVTDAARSATETLVTMAAQQLTEAATAELERRWASSTRAAGAGTLGRRQPVDTRRPRGRTSAGPSTAPPRPSAPTDRDQESLRRLRATIAALEATIDSLSAH